MLLPAQKHLKPHAFFLLLCLLPLSSARATVFSQVQGIVHDSQHRPLSGARITLTASHSDFTQSADSNSEGAFALHNVPLGDYTVTINHTGFATLQQPLTVHSDTSPILHFMLQIGPVSQSVTVTAPIQAANIDTVIPTTLINRIDIAQTPGADRTNSMAMITDYVPGAYMTHDMLHMRGGHELSWLIDGVEIPNTNIASNVGPQIDPKDIDSLEVERGSYSADLGDRTYGMFNVLPRSGFERSREGELVLTAGNFYQTNDQVSLGDHTEKFAWYTSLSGNRSNLGLQPAISQPVNDAENGVGGFASFIYNRDPADQLRLVTQVRSDYYQIPKDPNVNDWENQLYDSSGLSDGERETDSYAAFSWLHTFNPPRSAALALLPLQPSQVLCQIRTTSRSRRPATQTANYAGIQASVSTVIAKNSLSGRHLWLHAARERPVRLRLQRRQQLPVLRELRSSPPASRSLYPDNYKPAPWLTLSAGERQTHFAGALTEDTIYPRIGLAVQIPKLNWVFRGFYGHFYQPPPLTTITGPALVYAQSSGDSYLPLQGERNEEHQFGVQIPFHGWLLDADTFQTRRNNFLDHNNIGESSIFIPIPSQGALVQAWELTIRSPRLWHFGRAHLSYSNQIAQQIGGITGGLPAGSYCHRPLLRPLRLYRRSTTTSATPSTSASTATCPTASAAPSTSTTAPASPMDTRTAIALLRPLPASHTTDLSLWQVLRRALYRLHHALNVANARVLLDNSLTFGGFHYNDPRQLYAELRYRFKF